MSTALAIARYRERRRSPRTLMCVDLVVCGEESQWEERTCALSLNAHGVLLALETTVKIGQKVVIRNVDTSAERNGRVANLGRTYGRRREVAVEFTKPAPDFWLTRNDPKSSHRA